MLPWRYHLIVLGMGLFVVTGMALAGTIVSPGGVTFSGIVTEVRIEDVVVSGNQQRTVVVTTNGEFNTFSGGFASVAPGGFSDPVGFKFSGDPFPEESVFLTGFPDVILSKAVVTASEMMVGVASYTTNFAPGDLEFAQMTFSMGGVFEIRGSDQEPDNLIFVSATGDIVGRISGVVNAIPEPSCSYTLRSGVLLFAVWWRCRPRTRAACARG